MTKFILKHSWTTQLEDKQEEHANLTWCLQPLNEKSVRIHCQLPPYTSTYVQFGSMHYRLGNDSTYIITSQFSFSLKLTVIIHDFISSSFLEKDELSDVTFLVDGVSYYLHKQVLAMASPVFKLMLYGDFKESQSRLIELPDKDANLFSDFLTIVYNKHPIERNKKRAVCLLPLIYEYQLESHTKYFEELMSDYLSALIADIEKERSSQTSAHAPSDFYNQFYVNELSLLGILSEMFDNKFVYDKCVHRLTTFQTSYLSESKEFLRLSDKTQKSVYLKRLQFHSL